MKKFTLSEVPFAWLLFTVYIPLRASGMFIQSTEIQSVSARLALVIIIALFLYSIFRYNLRLFSGCSGAVLPFWGAIITSGISSDLPLIAGRAHFLAIATIVGGIGLAYSLKNLTQLHKSLSVALIGIAIALAGILTQFNLYALASGRFAPLGTNPNQVGLTFVPLFVICLYLSFKEHRLKFRICTLIVTFGLFLVILATGSRNSIGTSSVAMIVLVFFHCRNPRQILSGLIIASLLLIFFFMAYQRIELSGATRFMDVETVDKGRVEFWKYEISHIDNPWVGNGTKFYSEAGSLGWSNMHSIYVQIYYETGVFGCCLFLFFLGFCGVKLLKVFKYSALQEGYLAALLFGTALSLGLFESGSIRGLQIPLLLWGLAIGLIDRLQRPSNRNRVHSYVANRKIMRLSTMRSHTKARRYANSISQSYREAS